MIQSYLGVKSEMIAPYEFLHSTGPAGAGRGQRPRLQQLTQIYATWHQKLFSFNLMSLDCGFFRLVWGDRQRLVSRSEKQ